MSGNCWQSRAPCPCRSRLCCLIIDCMTLRYSGRPSSRLTKSITANAASARRNRTSHTATQLRSAQHLSRVVIKTFDCEFEFVWALLPRILAVPDARSTGAICRTLRKRVRN